MSIVSYAQNFEDVMLWRALCGVKEGFYIDIGAADPDEDSVTRAFYDRGWRGINIDPEPHFFEMLEAVRRRDTNLCCLVGEDRGETDFYRFQGTGLSTSNLKFAEIHTSKGFKYEVVKKPVLPLSEIWKQYVEGEVHFLKIDVEGTEHKVLCGADLERNRPWIILIEAIEPFSRVENWSEWDPLLTQAGYRYVWFDGLNRFYVAKEHWDNLHSAFKTPPNLFDLWIKPRGKLERAMTDQAQAQVLSATEAINASREAMLAVQSDLAAARTEIRCAIEAGNTAQKAVIGLRSDLEAAKAETLTAEGMLNGAREAIRTLQTEVTAAHAKTAAVAEAAELAMRDLRAEIAAVKAASVASSDPDGAALTTLHEDVRMERSEAVMLRQRLIAFKADDLKTRAEAARLRAEDAARAEKLAAELSQWRTAAEQLRGAIEHAHDERDRLIRKMAAMRATFFWRMGAPLRYLETLVHKPAPPPASLVTAFSVPATEVTPVAAAASAPADALAILSEEQRMIARLRVWAGTP